MRFAICILLQEKSVAPAAGRFLSLDNPTPWAVARWDIWQRGCLGNVRYWINADRQFIETLWQLEPGSLTQQVGSGTVDLFQRMADGDISRWPPCATRVTGRASAGAKASVQLFWLIGRKRGRLYICLR